MRLGFVTTLNTVVFTLHFSIGREDATIRQGVPAASSIHSAGQLSLMFGHIEPRTCSRERIPTALKQKVFRQSCAAKRLSLAMALTPLGRWSVCYFQLLTNGLSVALYNSLGFL